jgi:hypothetical protein
MSPSGGLLELSKYAATDDDLPEIFGAPSSATPPSPVYNFELQAARWLEGLRNRDCDPVAPSTLATFASRVKAILSVVGPWTKLEDFKNAAMRQFVQDAKGFNWAPSTLADHILVIKLTISSATDAVLPIGRSPSRERMLPAAPQGKPPHRHCNLSRVKRPSTLRQLAPCIFILS